MAELKLHLGCGDVRLQDFINIDCREESCANLVEDIGTLPSFKPDTVSVIYACHCLDHFSRHDYRGVLKRWRALLVPGGILRLSCVDFRVVAELYQQGTGVADLIGLLHARQDYPSNVRKMSWDYESLETDLFNAGFASVRPWEDSTLRDCSQARWPRGDENGRLISLNMEGVA